MVLRESETTCKTLPSNTVELKSPHRKLNEQLASEIFRLGPGCHYKMNSIKRSSMKGLSVAVSNFFGISPKTVRDIWNLRTWRHVTINLSSCTNVSGLRFARDYEGMISSPDDGDIGSAPCDPVIPLLFSSHGAARKSVGRPRGSKDKKPRRIRRAVRLQLDSSQLSQPVLERPVQAVEIPQQKSSTVVPCFSTSYQELDSKTVDVIDEAVYTPVMNTQLFSQHSADDDYQISIDSNLSRTYPFFLDLEF